MFFNINASCRSVRASKQIKNVPMNLSSSTMVKFFGTTISFMALYGNSLKSCCNLELNVKSKMSPPRQFGNHEAARRMLSSSEFGKSTSDSTDSSMNTKEHDLNKAVESNSKNKNCPICAKYSKGPCGEIFRAWLQCTDENPGQNVSTGQDLHLEKCLHLATPLAKCLTEHENYYSAIPLEYDDNESVEVGNENDTDSGQNVRQAWENIVREIESAPNAEKIRKHFPKDMAPEMEVRFESNTGVAFFSKQTLCDKDGKDLLLVFLKDQNGELLGAGTLDDIQQSGGWIRFHVLNGTDTVTLSALYGDDENGPLLSLTQRLPPRDKKQESLLKS